MMKYKLWLMLAVAVVIGGGIVAQAFAGHDSKPEQVKKQALTASQKAARKKLLATADLLEKNGLNCGCQHHFPAQATGG